jgi:hypothetical protein
MPIKQTSTWRYLTRISQLLTLREYRIPVYLAARLADNSLFSDSPSEDQFYCVRPSHDGGLLFIAAKSTFLFIRVYTTYELYF